MADLTYKELQATVIAKEKAHAQSAEAIRSYAEVFKEIAADTKRDADQLGAKSVDPDSRSECQELAKVVLGLSDGATAYAAKADTTARTAHAAGDVARAGHGGFQEQFDRSTVTDLVNVSSDWFEVQ